MKNYYNILEVEPTATLEQIKSQHRFLIHAWHPDKFPASELRDKANEKVREINEAYSVLSDSVKRENYDKNLHSYSSSPAQATPFQPPKNSQSEPPKEYCQSCGLPVETKYVEFYENVGMIFMRQHRSVKGNFCKSCINYYFWNLTGKTVLLGWWGTISLIVTPFILLNNFFRFVSTMGMKKPPLSITPGPSAIWVITTSGSILIVGFFLFSMCFSLLPLPSSPPPEITVPPTQVPIKVKTPTLPPPSCLRWDKITITMEGRKVCVYGTVYDIYKASQIGTRIKFTLQPNTFFLDDPVSIYPDLKKGDCVAAEEVVQRYGEVPYMRISDLYVCESWMK